MRYRRPRPSPLRRRSDVVEMWTMLAVAVLLFVVAPSVGVMAAWWAHDDALDTVQEQRADRRHIRAEVVGGTSGTAPLTPTGRQPSTEVTVRWNDPLHGPRTTTAHVPADTRTGETIDIWLNSRNRSVPPPPDDTAVWQHTVISGMCATGGTVALILLGHGVVRHSAMRRRLAEWDREWARTEPQWTGRRA
ncbi:hypothetical protein GCM10018780_54150 [Streptomyces lanatus]|nr:hypothetical protein GCM10018780_54150 [Streptomyces lanatus]